MDIYGYMKRRKENDHTLASDEKCVQQSEVDSDYFPVIA